MDVIKFQDNPDSPSVAFPGEPAEKLPVFFIFFRSHFQGFRVIRNLHQRGKGMPAPDVKDIAAFPEHAVQKFLPHFLIVEPGETIRGDRVFIGMSRRLQFCFLKAHTRPPQLKGRCIIKIEFSGQFLFLTHQLRQLQASVKGSRSASAADHRHFPGNALKIKAFSFRFPAVEAKHLLFLQPVHQFLFLTDSHIKLFSGNQAVFPWMFGRFGPKAAISRFLKRCFQQADPEFHPGFLFFQPPSVPDQGDFSFFHHILSLFQHTQRESLFLHSRVKLPSTSLQYFSACARILSAFSLDTGPKYRNRALLP